MIFVVVKQSSQQKLILTSSEFQLININSINKHIKVFQYYKLCVI